MKKPPVSYDIAYTPTTAKMIKKLTPQVRELCKNAIERLARNPCEGKALKGRLDGLRSFRTSSYRIVYSIEETKITIIVVAVGHRRDIYERLKRMLYP